MSNCKTNFGNVNDDSLEFHFDHDKENMNGGALESSDFIHKCHIINMKKTVSAFRKTPRRIPNILKNSAKLIRDPQIIETQREWSATNVDNVVQNVQVSVMSDDLSGYILGESEPISNEKCLKGISHKRKQEFNFTDVWHGLPIQDICHLIDQYNEMSNKRIFKRKKSRPCVQRKKLPCIRKQKKKQSVSTVDEEHGNDPRCSKSQNTSADFHFDHETFPPLQGMEFENFQDTIDFSSNEIFHKFSYEFDCNNSLEYSSWCTMDSDETCNFPSTELDSSFYENEFDINANEVNTCKTTINGALYKNNQSEEHISTNHSSLFSEFVSEDSSSPVSNQVTDLLRNSCCSYCLEDCASNWFATCMGQYNIGANNDLQPDIRNEDLENDLNLSLLEATETKSVSIEGELEGRNDGDSGPTIIHNKYLTGHVDNTDPLMVEFINDSTEDNIDTDAPEHFTHTEMHDEINVLSDLSDDIHYNPIFHMFEEQMEDLYNPEVSKIFVKNNAEIASGKELQCSLCSLTFLKARTMSMHQGAAHGDPYIILCECCGRLFNRRDLFHRHFAQCRYLKAPLECDLCRKKYRYKSSLVYHLKVEHHINYSHNQSGTINCNICNKVYNNFLDFQNHIKSCKNTW